MPDSYVFNLVDDARNSHSTNVPLGMNYTKATRAFYEDFQDNYDFVVFLYAGAASTAPIFKDVHTPVRRGLGITKAIDDRAAYGSSRLTGVVAVALDMAAGAPPPYIHAGLMRNWGVYLQGVDARLDYASWAATSGNGVRGGFDVKSLRDAADQPIADPTTVAPNAVISVNAFPYWYNAGKPYSPIELWLMGLMDPVDVGDLYSMINPVKQSASSTATTYKNTTQGIRRITIDNILARNEDAPPKAENKAFRTAFVLLTSTPASPEMMAKAEHYAKVIGGIEQDTPPTGPRLLSFAEATGSRATMDVRLDARPPVVKQLAIHPNNRFITATLDAPTFDGWRSGTYSESSATVVQVTRHLYKKFKDEFDFVVFVLDIDAVPAGKDAGKYCPVSNDVQGIGRSIFNDASAYASFGKLKGYFTLWQRDYVEQGPFLHEFAHHWANYVLPAERILNGQVIIAGKSLAGPPVVPGESHWGHTGCGGQLGGFDQSTLAFDATTSKYKANMPGRNNFNGAANGGNSVPYSNFELYLMGLVAESELTSFDSFTGISIDAADGMQTATTDTWNGKFRATTRVTYTKEKIVADFGARVPNATGSQKEFKVLVVALTADDALTQTNATNLDEMLKRMSMQDDDGQTNDNFWKATGGRGTITFDLSRSLK